MPPLEPPEAHYLAAAIGWFELGNLAEAWAELVQLRAASQRHPDVLEVRWMLLAQESRWADGLEVARLLLQAAPERATGWLHQAYALRRIRGGGVEQAREALLPVCEKFPDEVTIPYNLACYACQLHRLEEARTWLKRAVATVGRERVRAMALADADLEPLWGEIREW